MGCEGHTLTPWALDPQTPLRGALILHEDALILAWELFEDKNRVLAAICIQSQLMEGLADSL